MAEIRIENAVKTFGKVVAVNNVSLTVHDQEFVVLLGPSGCGKTTLLRAIAGLGMVDSGRIKIGDRDVTYLPPKDRNISMVFQGYAIFPHMNVFDNIAFGLKMKRTPKDEIARRVKEAAELLHIEEFLERFPSQLSGGQRQRVAVARAIAVHAEVLLMDEPLSNLDAKLRLDMRAELLRLHRDLGSTTVYVTHDQAEALTLSDRIVVMDRGYIVQQGAPFDIYHRPKNLLVAEFIGEPRINLLSGNLVDEGSALRLDCGSINLPAEHAAHAKGRELIASVRPENIKLSAAEVAGWQRVVLDYIQPTGASTILQVRAGDNRLRLVQPGFVRMESGAPLWIDFDSDSINFFDPESKENLSAAGPSQH